MRAQRSNLEDQVGGLLAHPTRRARRRTGRLRRAVETAFPVETASPVEATAAGDRRPRRGEQGPPSIRAQRAA